MVFGPAGGWQRGGLQSAIRGALWAVVTATIRFQKSAGELAEIQNTRTNRSANSVASIQFRESG